MNSTDLIKKAWEILSEYDSKNGSLVVIAVEMDNNGLPVTRAIKCYGGPGLILGSSKIIQNMIEDLNKDQIDKINKLGETSDEILEILGKLGIKPEDLINSDKLKNLIDSDDDAIKEIINKLKNKFGK